MTEAERIELLRSYCQFSHYPPALTDAICDHLAGQGTLEQVRQAARPGLLNIFAISPALLSAWQFGRHPSASQWAPLDALDCRLLECCEATDQVWACVQQLHDHAIVRRALDYLLAQGMTPHALLRGVAGSLHLAFSQHGQLTEYGQALLNLLPTHLEILLKRFSSGPSIWQSHSQAPQLVQMLLAKEPPALEDAWRIVEELEQKEEPAHMHALGHCARLLLRVAPERFTPWARKLAGPDSRASLESRLIALQALLELDTAQHSDLAVEALRSPFLPFNWRAYQLQLALLEALSRFDSLKYLPLIGEVAVFKDSWLAPRALQLLIQAPAEQARPHLQQCVEAGGIAIASGALQALLGAEWAGRQNYALSLLAHRSRRVRREVAAWLAQQGDAALAGIAPFLTHPDPAIRLSTRDALAASGSERALALLAARLDLEPSARVRQAIFEAVGLPAEQRASGPLTRETLQAAAFATLHYVHKPAPRWFVASEVPMLLWANNEPVPSSALLYLVYRQSLVNEPGVLDHEVSQALPLLNRSTTGSLANYLFRGWIEQGASAKEAWCLPLICALGDDALLPALSLRVEDWSRDNRRKLAIRIIQALPLFERQAALNELRSLAKLLRRGIVKTAAKATLAAASQP